MSAAEVGLSHNSRLAMGGFYPSAVAVGGKTPGSIGQGERAAGIVATLTGLAVTGAAAGM